MTSPQEPPTGDEATGSVRAGLDSRWLTNLDLRGYGDVSLEIERVFKRRDYEFEVQGKKSRKSGIAVKFKGRDKYLLLNATNEAAFIRWFNSAKAADWIGQSITLFADPNVEAFGRRTGGVRVREQ